MHFSLIKLLVSITISLIYFSPVKETQEFQGKAYYFSKSKMELGVLGSQNE